MHSTDFTIAITTDHVVEDGVKILNVRFCPKADGFYPDALQSDVVCASFLPTDRPARLWQGDLMLASSVSKFCVGKR
jgi:hypothetical protein